MPRRYLPDGSFIDLDDNGNMVSAGSAPGPAPTTPAAPANVNIDPNAGAPPPAAAPPPPSATTPTSTGGPAAGPQGVGGYTVAQIIAPYQDELLKAHGSVVSLQDSINTQQQRIDYLTTDPKGKQEAVSDPSLLTNATSSLNAQYNAMSLALGRVQTANTTLATATTNAIHDGTVDPKQVEVANATVTKANADANEADARAKVLLEGSDNAKALTAAQAALAAANAGQAEATAAAITAKTPAEKAQLEAQASALQAQGDSTRALIGPLVEKTKAETVNLGAQSDQAQAQARLDDANASSATADAALKKAQLDAGLPAAQVAATQGQAAQSQAAAAAQLAGIQKDQLGGIYGLQQQVDAIRQIQNQVFGPGGSGDPKEATDLLNQYVTARIAGTSPYEANVAAANAGLTAFGTQASLANAAQAAAASRANAYTGFGSSALTSLLGVMKDAPAGSQLLGPAFNDVMNQMSARTAQGQYAPPTQPTAPTLPALLQKLAPGGQSAVQPGLAMPQGPPLPGPAAAPVIPQTGGAPQTSAPITINVGGGNPAPGGSLSGLNLGGMPGAGQQGQQSTPMEQAGLSMPTGPSPSQSAYVAGQGVGQSALPGVLQQHAPAGMDYVHQLWGNELQNGAVRSPYAAMGQGA